MTTAFHMLTGTVRLPVSIPARLAGGLDAFYVHPNDEEWAGTLCRILFHESVHFWQLLSWGYLGNVIAEQWRRLEARERDGVLPPLGALTEGYLKRGDQPFSAYELVECWARYWDVHVRSPARLLDEETVVRKEIVHPVDGTTSYTSDAFDHVMAHGDDAQIYAAPYRTLLERAAGDSHFVNTVFPPIVFFAFGTPSPVAFVLAAFERALAVQREQGPLHQSGNINFDWLDNWLRIREAVIEPVRRELRMPDHTSGFDVIVRGPLRSHAVYAEYPRKSEAIMGHLRMRFQEPSELMRQAAPSRMMEMAATIALPRQDPWVVFALPGHPDYRSILGRYVPPPRVCFTDASIDASRSAMSMLQKHQNGPLTAELEALAGRVARFDHAVYAVSKGLPPDAFE